MAVDADGLASTVDTLSLTLEQIAIQPLVTDNPSERYGNLWSLYHTLDVETIALLEKATLYNRVRGYEQSDAIINAFPPALKNHPVVAFEHSQNHWLSWRVRDCHTILRDAVAWTKMHGGVDAPEIYTLLRISLARVEVIVETNFTRARESLREIKRWLLNTPIDEYNDVKVQCVTQYYFLLLMAENATGTFDEASYLCIPRVSDGSLGHPLSQLREHLQKKGRLRDAGAVLTIELTFLPDQESRLRACTSLLEASSDDPTEPLWYVQGRARLSRAQKLRGSERISESDIDFQLARDLLQRAPVSPDFNYSGLDISLGELQTSRTSDYKTLLNEWKAFSEQPSVQKDGFMLSTALTKAAEAALELLRATPSQTNREVFWYWQSRQEAHLQKLGDIYFLYVGHVGTADLASELFDNYGVMLTWYKEFDQTHPNFKCWGLHMAGKSKVVHIYTRLGDGPNIDKTLNEMTEIIRQRDQFWEEDSYKTQSMAEMAIRIDSGDVGDSSETSVYKSWLAEWVDEVPLTFKQTERSHIQLGTQNPIAPRAVLGTLLRWLKTASVDGTLQKEELACIFSREHEVEQHLANLTPEILHTDLFGTETLPTSSTAWQMVFDILSDWLRNRVTYNEAKRHYLLFQIQHDKLSTTKDLQDIAIQAQRLMDLIPTLAQEVQQVKKSSLPHWRNMLASAKIGMYNRQNGAPLSNDKDPKFIEVLDLYKLSLEEAVKRGDLLAEASTALYIVHLYFWAVIKCNGGAVFAEYFKYLDQCNDAFQKNREGWKALSGWEKVRTLLQAVSERLRLEIIPLAVVALCQLSKEVVETRDTAIWSAIQMGKSIGLGWLMQTNNLDQALMNTLPSTGYKEIPTITPEDMSEISADAGGDVVYVDWYRQTAPLTKGWNPLVVIVLPGKPPLVTLADITWEEIDRVVEKFLDLEEEDLDKKLLRKLNPLVQPLAEHTKPDQVLVFSSVEKLHQVPLHALMVDKRVLIERNPIVYCSSLTVLDAIFKSQKVRQKEILASSPSEGALPTAAIFGQPPSDEGKQALGDLSKQLSSKAHTSNNEDFTSSAFQSAINIPDLDIFHYHGHAYFAKGDQLGQGLQFDDKIYALPEVFELSAGGQDPSEPSTVPVLASSTRKRNGGYHATLLGCSSGMSTTQVSSDVVGLVPAFLYAGAASTVSGLWRLEDKDAAIYSQVFYAESFLKPVISESKISSSQSADVNTPAASLTSESQSIKSDPVKTAADEPFSYHSAVSSPPGTLQERISSDKRINLAIAHQRAVLAVKEKKPGLVHWAPFVLNGYWMR